MTDAAPVSPKLAATILLLRDGAHGLEVFMVVRHQQIDFASGALVFPGGKLADGDRDPRLVERLRGLPAAADEQRALRAAAIREAFEECGLLLAAPASAPADRVGGSRLEQLRTRYRQLLERGELGIGDLLEAEDLIIDGAALQPFAHWITPAFMSKRFDTWFYLAEAPVGQALAHDGHEAVDSVWIRPQDAIADARAGTRTLVPATQLNLEKLARSNTVAEAFAAARGAPIVTVLPERVEGVKGIRLRIPSEAGYSCSEFEFAA